MSQVAHHARTYPGFCSMKQLGVHVFQPPPPPPGLDVTNVAHCRITPTLSSLLGSGTIIIFDLPYLVAKLWNYICKFSTPTSFSTTASFCNLYLYLVNCTILPLSSLVLVSFKLNRVLIIIGILIFFSYIMGSALHGSLHPVRTLPIDLITSYHFAYIFHFFSVIYLVVCNICNGQ